MEKKVDLSMFLDFNSSIAFLKNFKKKCHIFNDDNWDIDIYNKNKYEEYLKNMPFFYLDFDEEYDSKIQLEYHLLKKIPWHYDFDIYEKVLDELYIINKDDLWNNYNYTKKYINNKNDDTKTKHYIPNINEIKKYIPRGYLIAPIDTENIELKIDKTINENLITLDKDTEKIPDNSSEEKNQTKNDIDKLYNIIIGNDIDLTKETFTKFINNDDNKIFFDISYMPSDRIIKYYFDNNNSINLQKFKEKTAYIISFDEEKYLKKLKLLVNNKYDTLVEEKFTNMSESSVNPINDETNKPKSYNFFNFKNKSWEKKIINMSLWLFLYILIIIFIFIIVISFIK
tara:strand:+ start:66 stop:1088 length:1023 start_codon:yes stop_codon:yes gene_type:complete